MKTCTRNERRRSGRRAAGFTLIEVLIVLAIVLALGGVVAYNLMPRREEGIEKTVRIQLQMLEGALDQFQLDFGRYPTDEEGIAVLWDKTLLENEDEEAKHMGNYLREKNIKDHWGNEFGYRFPSETDETTYDLWSNGKDGEEGTEDDITLRESSEEDGYDMGTIGDGG
ncbi:MAG: type II secretion system protein GspG [Planctomycetes bacterium]|nr:type II secretion system protein GspG [Planctomycetota bacterium]NOG54408.1 type II secretion system major pseudopilin GspG [Planctomycetota bacterium]